MDTSSNALAPVVVALGLAAASPLTWGQEEPEEFDEAKVIVEINATDGDIGFHALLDGDAWRETRIESPEGKLLFNAKAKANLREQGLTENFFESDEPLCAPDPEEPDAEVVPLSEFLERFPAGEYQFTGKTLENERLESTAELTHSLPAAPVDVTFDGSIVTWAAGSDLGRCQQASVISEGVIPDPGTVEVIGWEVAVEPADDEAVDPLRVFVIQLPAEDLAVTVPAEFVNSYLADGVTEFKVEVGAIEETGNQTFTEEEFELEPSL